MRLKESKNANRHGRARFFESNKTNKLQESLYSCLTEVLVCGIIRLITFEQEPVTKSLNNRELSVGARQLLGFGEFLLRVAD